MPSVSKHIDACQGYNFEKDKQTPVGFITRLKLGDKELKADQTCKNPMNPDESIQAVAVLNAISWEVGVTEAVFFSGQVSDENKQSIMGLSSTAMTDILCELQFQVFEYDPVQKKYYLCFHSNGRDLKGLIEKKGEDLNISVAEDPSREVESPLNYAVRMAVKPRPEAQTLHLATADQKSFTKPWGL